MKKLAILLLIPASVIAQAPKEFKIKTELPAGKSIERVMLTYRNGETVVRDTIKVSAGEFKYKGMVQEPTLATISFESKDVLFKTGNIGNRIFSMPLYLDGGNFEIRLADSIQASTAKGPKAHTEYLKLQEAVKPYREQLNTMNAPYQQAAREKNQAEMDRLMKFYDSLNLLINEKVYKAYLQANPSSPIAMYALRQYAGYQLDPAVAEPLFLKLPAATRSGYAGKSFAQQLDIAKKTSIGKVAMDFSQADSSGNMVSLSSFRGQYVLVDFWASWCGPCRRENPNIVKAFNQYKDKNFTILGVSLDRPNDRAKWIKAIHADNLTWHHVSDLKWWDNAVAKQYGIQSIPANFLIDPQGKILARNLHGEELEKKLAEIFSSEGLSPSGAKGQ